MATRDAYQEYKRDTGFLLYWIIQTSNNILKASTGKGNGKATAGNTTGELTVAGILTLAELIAKHNISVSPIIFRLFRSVIDARTAAHASFLEFAAWNPDPAIESSNKSHKFFIDALTKAVKALGGQDWRDKGRSDTVIEDDDTRAKAQLDQLVLENRFRALGLEGCDGLEDDDESEEGPQRDPSAVTRRRQQTKKRRGKKGGRPKKCEKTPEEPSLDKYRIIKDEDGEYQMAVYALAKSITDTRGYVQHSWAQCAYGGLNSAVVAPVSKLAIAMIQRSSMDIFVDFPGREPYDVVIYTLTHGKMGTPQERSGFFTLKLGNEGTTGGDTAPGRDVQEQAMMYAYRDMVDFVEDFRKTRTGKPTKRMLSELQDWDPDLNLEEATSGQRVQWRRVYTIRWLYDLVNLFSSLVVDDNAKQKKKKALESVDWSTQGYWENPRIFGHEFAGFITSLAMQKEGSPFRQRILPHHVFELQCIVDSFMVSRGWFINALGGHIPMQPPRDYHSRRDIDMFLDRNIKNKGPGFLEAANRLSTLLAEDITSHYDCSRRKLIPAVLDGLHRDFANWLGESNGRRITQSRFGKAGSDGLWKYSPFLCGIGLMEALELSYGVSMFVWDQIPEPRLLMHLHNMLLKKGYIEKPWEFYASLESWFGPAFFQDGKAPTSHFKKALAARIGVVRADDARYAERKLDEAKQEALRTANIHRLFDVEANHFFNIKSNLILYRRAKWSMDAIPEADISSDSLLFEARLGQTAIGANTTTAGEHVQGMNKEESKLGDARTRGDDGNQGDDRIATLPPNMSVSEPTKLLELLEAAKCDLYRDLSRHPRPLSGMNYLGATITMMALFKEIEDELDKRRNPLYVTVYEKTPHRRRHEREDLTLRALNGEDDECLGVMAQVFQFPRYRFSIYFHHYFAHMLDDHT